MMYFKYVTEFMNQSTKRDLETGEKLDGIRGFTCYGVLENSGICRRENLLPMGLSEGCSLKRRVTMDKAISYDDVELPAERLCDRLRAEQNDYFLSKRGDLISRLWLGARAWPRRIWAMVQAKLGSDRRKAEDLDRGMVV